MIERQRAEQLRGVKTPFYYYDIELLKATLETIKEEISGTGYKIHYAVKANHNRRILETIARFGFGADCVSWNEADAALKAGFEAKELVFAGVGKTDQEIEAALKAGIFCFNCESVAEMEVIDQLAGAMNKRADIAIRINPNIDAHTHKYITTGVDESKFGIYAWALEEALEKMKSLKNLVFKGIHFHIGSQITQMDVFEKLCEYINEMQSWFESKGLPLKVINLGGGLGVDYNDPEKPADFRAYFNLVKRLLIVRPGQEVHFEPGRSLVAQCGSLISRVLYIKEGKSTKFAVIDAGMTDLIRPALYQAFHKIENLTSTLPAEKYDVVGPVCESSDCFIKGWDLPQTKRGDLLALRSAGAYGEAMASRYNLRGLPESKFSDEF
jgi:diaminopimelate decarboxylase